MRLLNLVVPALVALSAGQVPPDSWVDPSPHRSDSAVVNGVALHYLDWGGTGEPLLLLAGLFGSAHGFDDIRRFLDLMKIERVHLAGVSAGGVEAALFAARYPDRVASVVFLDSA